MIQTYSVLGMTCNGCRSSVEQKLNSIDGVLKATVDLSSEKAIVESLQPLSTIVLQKGLPKKFTISVLKTVEVKPSIVNSLSTQENELSKFQQLKPLLLIFGCIILLVGAQHYGTWQLNEMMLDFMGTFFLIFSLFKFFDLKGFATSFAMYDPIAKSWNGYGYGYPFMETILGVLFLTRIEIPTLLILTIIILSITTIGVTQALLGKKNIKCACLGTVLKLPMTEATFIENAIMIFMALILIFKHNI